MDTPGTITSDGDTTTVIISRRAYSPVLRQADLRADTIVPLVARTPPPLPVRLTRTPDSLRGNPR
jgi:hypothetical protein